METKITKTIILKYQKDKKGIYCSTNEAFKLIWGTSTNPFDIGHKYGITRKDGKYFITMKVLKERKKFIEERIRKLNGGLRMLDKALK